MADPNEARRTSAAVSFGHPQLLVRARIAFLQAVLTCVLVVQGIALSQTNVAKSLNALIKGEVDYDQENEGEGMEVSLDNRVGNSRTVAEI